MNYDFSESENKRLLDPELRDRLRFEINRLSDAMPTKDHKRVGIEETLLRVIMRGLPKDDEIHRIIGVINMSKTSLSNDKGNDS